MIVRRIAFAMLLFVSASAALSQVQVKGKVSDADGDEIQSAVVQLISIPASEKRIIGTDSHGAFTLQNVAPGRYVLSVSAIGYAPHVDTVEITGAGMRGWLITMQEEAIGEEEVVVSATRTARDIAEVPYRIELLPADDLDEAITTGLGSAKLVLMEVPGVITQVTASGLGATVIRLHGLDGRYTQTLVDGIPAYGGVNLNFSVAQLPPLNLKQLEIVKGAAAGLHTDAIGGIVDYITRVPHRATPELTSVVSYSSFGGVDLAAFYGQSCGDLGFSLHATYDTSPRKDLDADDYADIPFQRRYNINPKLLYALSSSTQLTFTGNLASEDRLGGQISAPEEFDHGVANWFSTGLRTRRADGSVSLTTKLDSSSTVTAVASYAQTQRNSYRGLVPFDGMERIEFADAAWSGRIGRLRLLLGMSEFHQRFDETTRDIGSAADRSFSFNDVSLFSQAEYAFTPTVVAMTSLRWDDHNQFGTVATPTLSLMLRPSGAVTLRGSAGMGWHAPTLFDEDAEQAGYRGVPPLAVTTHESGHSFSFDTRYKGVLGDWVLTADLALFQTAIYDRIGLVSASLFPPFPAGPYQWAGIGHQISRGVELLTESRIGGLNIIFGYVFSDVREESGGALVKKVFTPEHFVSGGITWEIPQTIRVGSDYRIESSQLLPLNPYAGKSTAFAIIDLSVELWFTKNLSVSLNSENMFDARQTNTMPLFLGTPNRDDFNSNFVWGPVEGRVFNLGVKFKL